MSPKTLRNVVTAVALLVLGLMATGVLIKMARKPERKTPPASRPVVAVITVPEEATPVQIRSFGSVRAKRSVTIVPQVSGEVLAKSAAFESGSFITAGEVLLRIDDTDYVMAAATARSRPTRTDSIMSSARMPCSPPSRKRLTALRLARATMFSSIAPEEKSLK